MITRQDLDEAILECQGEKSPNANTCIKLAAFLTIKEHLYPDRVDRQEITERPTPEEGYSYDTGPGITYTGESEFAEAIYGRDPSEVFPVLDELMDTIRVINPRLYAGVMRRLS